MTEQDREFSAEELRRYFQEADGELGVRSSQSGFEAQMNQRALIGRTEDGGMRVRETRQSNSPADGQPFCSLEAARALSRIHRGITSLAPEHVRTLELSYSADADFGGVPMALAADTAEARACFRQSMAASTTGGGKNNTISTPRGWLAWLAGRALLQGCEKHALLLGVIINSARTRLDAAIDAYMEATDASG